MNNVMIIGTAVYEQRHDYHYTGKVVYPIHGKIVGLIIDWETGNVTALIHNHRSLHREHY